MPDPKVSKSNDWCVEIGERCAFYEQYIKKNQTVAKGCELTGLCPDTLANFRGITAAKGACHAVSRLCREGPPRIPFPDDDTALMESQTHHDVEGFFEVAGPLIGDYLPKPEGDEPALNVLYPCSGEHIAPFELGFQVLEKTGYRRVDFTYTEIDESYFKGILGALENLRNDGTLQSVKEMPRKTGEDGIYSERIVECGYKTRAGEEKSVRIRFVLGKVVGDKYPPYFRPEDFDEADLVIVFDAEDVDVAVKNLNEAVSRDRGKASGKTVLIEGRPEYLEWALRNGRDIKNDFSQHFGCEVPQKDVGGLRPVILKLK